MAWVLTVKYRLTGGDSDSDHSGELEGKEKGSKQKVGVLKGLRSYWNFSRVTRGMDHLPYTGEIIAEERSCLL